MKTYDVVEWLKVRLKSAAAMFSDEELEQAVTTAQAETGWSLPVSAHFRTFWICERSLRAAIAMLCIDSAHKFKFKQINLQHRFEHYNKMLQQMDEAFEKAKAAHPEEFVDSALSEDDKIKLFGTYHAPSFRNPAR